jgi:quinoprotein glucose dehydrogenase
MRNRVGRVLLLVCLLLPLSFHAEKDWPNYGNDSGGMRYSPLKQINTSNVAQLRRAWEFHTGDTSGLMEAPPLVINGVMYVTASNGVFALEPETGKQIWKFQAKVETERGSAYWPGDTQTTPRILTSIEGDLLVAIDAKTGKPITEFGKDGHVEMGGPMMSAPVIYKDLVITGNRSANVPGVRAWNIRIGELVWSFNTAPKAGEPGAETWKGSGQPQARTWGLMSVDQARGLVFVPTAGAGGVWGGNFAGSNLYSNSLVALNAATGKLVWYQQLIHHDIWDFDSAATPVLIDITRDGQKIPAVVQMTKVGLVFIFDRTTGKPVFGMEERPVPQSEVPGEVTSPTQPFPLKPAPLGRFGMKADELYNLTPEHAAFCKELWEKNKMYNDGPYTAYSTDRLAVIFPGTLGSGNWMGVSFDPELGYIFANVQNLGQIGILEKRTDTRGEVMYGKTSPFGGGLPRFWDPATQLPCQAPPWGELIAVNASTGDIVWRTPLGIVEQLAAKGITNTGSPNLGGTIVTAGGLIFVAATTDSRFRAFDSRTGKELWTQKIEANGHTTPITFEGKNGKQYVAIAIGGKGNHNLGKAVSDTVAAYALP